LKDLLSMIADLRSVHPVPYPARAVFIPKEAHVEELTACEIFWRRFRLPVGSPTMLDQGELRSNAEEELKAYNLNCISVLDQQDASHHYLAKLPK